MFILEIDPVSIGIGVGVAVAICVVVYFVALKGKGKVAAAPTGVGAATIQEAEAAAQKIKDQAAAALADAERKSKDMVREAKIEARDSATKERERVMEDLDKERKEIKKLEERIIKREESLDSKFELLDKKADKLDAQEKEVEKLKQRIDEARAKAEQVVEQQKEKLLAIAGISKDEAKAQLLTALDAELVTEKQQRIDKVEKLIQEHADEKAKWTISQAIVRLASEHTGETTTFSLTLPKDDIKGKIIGREGRNIRSFEKITGCDLIVDDTPGVVVVSCFDSVRREVGRRTLEKLVEDGRIHPARIEEVFQICEKEVDKEIDEAGKRIQFDADVHNIHPKAQKLLGRLKFRSSYGQNVYKHTVEVAYLMGMMCSELGLDPKLGRRCGLMHDIGKAIDHEQEGGHPYVGGEFLKKIGERPEVIEAAAGHHDNVLNHKFVYTSLAAAADAISASRPGARRESMERYIQRLQSLEAVAKGFEGVSAAFAIQAGREIRVIVDHAQVDDEKAQLIARDIARQIEEELTYPGEIRVTLLRETRVVEYAR